MLSVIVLRLQQVIVSQLFGCRSH